MTKEPTNSLFIVGGKVFGGNGWNEPEWHESVFVRNGKITAVGNRTEIKSLVDESTAVLDINGSILLPGLCDAHLHLVVGGESLAILNLEGMNFKDVNEALEQLHNENLHNTELLEAFNWDPTLCLLNADILESIVPNKPLIIHQKDLHGCCCNRTALQLSGLANSSATEYVHRLSDGKLSGLLYESAVEIALSIKPTPTVSKRIDYIKRSTGYLSSLGLTAVSEVLNAGDEECFRELDSNDELDLDIDAWLRVENWDGSPPPPPGKRFQIRTLKVFLDGSFGSRTAALNSPYNDSPGNSGNLLFSDDDLTELCRRATGAGWRLALHAIGERAIEQGCRILTHIPRIGTTHHRIEHAELLPENGIDLFVKSSSLASIQPVHLLDDQNWLPERIGSARCHRTFVWKSLLDNNVPIAIGTDWPVANPSPLMNIHVTIQRASFGSSPSNIFPVAESLSPAMAIRSATYGFAVASGWTSRRGAIVPGLQADFTVVSDLPPLLDDWSNASVRYTISKGKVIYQNNN